MSNQYTVGRDAFAKISAVEGIYENSEERTELEEYQDFVEQSCLNDIVYNEMLDKLGEKLWEIAVIANALNISLDDIMMHNINKRAWKDVGVS